MRVTKILIVAALAAVLVPTSVAAQADKSADRQLRAQQTEEQLKKLEQFYFYINELYVDTLDSKVLTESAIRGVLDKLDPHSAYITAEEMKSVREDFGGSFSGIGVEFDVLNDTLTVVNALSGGPSEELGIMAGDKIVAIDGKSVIAISKLDVPKVLRGPKGTVVVVDIVRHGQKEPLTFRIVRDNIPIYTIDAAYKVDEHTGYIRVNRFAETTSKEFYEAAGKLGDIDALILDLRSNGGGIMGEAIEMAGFFLPKGSKIVSTEGRSQYGNNSFTSSKSGRFTKGRVAVLIDSSSASASEIVTGALQDWDRAVVIGQPSFGKGLVQRQIPLIDSSAVRITVARYLTPTGRAIQRPFTKGNAGDYYADHYRRMLDHNYRDSINADAPKFLTLRNKRNVFGSGGITPDIEIAIDTAQNYAYWNQLVRGGYINEFVNTWLETNRSSIEKSYPDFESFVARFTVDSKMKEELAALGRSHGIVFNEGSNDNSIKSIEVQIKALVARKLWSTTEYFRVVNATDDKEFEQARKVLSDTALYNSILGNDQ